MLTDITNVISNFWLIVSSLLRNDSNPSRLSEPTILKIPSTKMFVISKSRLIIPLINPTDSSYDLISYSDVSAILAFDFSS